MNRQADRIGKHPVQVVFGIMDCVRNPVQIKPFSQICFNKVYRQRHLLYAVHHSTPPFARLVYMIMGCVS